MSNFLDNYLQNIPDHKLIVTQEKNDRTVHAQSTLTNSNLTMSIKNNKLILRTWQGIYLFEHRIEQQVRKVFLHIIGQN